MTAVPDEKSLELAGKLRSLHEAAVRAELAAADREAPGSDTVAWSGALLADVAVVKGLAGPAESSGGAAMSGRDGEAVERALTALGFSAEAIFSTLSRPDPEIDGGSRARRLRLQIEAVDPAVVVALDAEAAADVAAAFGLSSLEFGVAVREGGRRLVAVDGLERSLDDEKAKRAVWVQLKAARADESVY